MIDMKYPCIAPLASSMGIRMTGTSVRDNINDAHTQVKSILAFLGRYPDVDIVFPIMDTSVEARAAGCPFIFKDSVPVITEHVYANPYAVSSIDIPDPYKTRSMRVNIDVVRFLAAEVKKPVACFVIGPVTLAAHLMGMTPLVRTAMNDRDGFWESLVHCTYIIRPYAQALQDAGASLVVVLEPQMGMFAPRIYEKTIKDILEEFTIGLFDPVLHVCGDTNRHIPLLAQTQNFMGLSLDAPVDFAMNISQYPILKDKVLIGNIDPVSVMLRGTPDLVRSKVSSLLDAMKDEEFILSSGCDLVPDTPAENMDMFMETALSYRQ
jgi:uroporphyrinogen decarboxylase